MARFLMCGIVMLCLFSRAFAQEAERPGPETDPGADPHLEAGAAAFARGDLDAAVQAYSLAVEKDPANWRARFERGNALAWKGDLDRAIDDYRAAMTRATNVDDPHHGLRIPLAEALLAAGKLEDAETELKTIEVDPNRSPWSYVLRGQLELRRGDRPAAEASLQEAARRDPETGDLAFAAACRLAQFGRHERALWLYAAVEILSPKNHSVHYWRGSALAALGRKTEAAVAYRRYLEFDATTEWSARAKAAIAELER